MKTTLSWLKQHLETDADLATLTRTLTMFGLEVDNIEDRGAALAPFKVAYVVSAEQHPNADKLKLCKVDTGSETIQVVCGAPNARAGLKVVFAPSGSTIPRTGLVLKPSEIRGVKSNGMMCSAYEMGLSEDHEGIIELPAEAPVGEPFAAVLGLDDPLLDIKITPNRADCLGVRGIARDLAAAGLGTLKPLAVEKIPGRFPSPVKIHIAGEALKDCPMFVGRVIRGVRNGPSPAWLQERLTSIGLRPISALVDITNYMTFDVNRPLHVFDVAKVKGDLTVHPAKGGETLLALNGKEYALEPGMVAISDASGVVSLGGVMGGETTGCDEGTVDVLIEAALFDPTRTAETGRRLSVQSDARYRFERGVDPAFVRDGIEIATKLVLELCGGEPGEVTVTGAEPHWQRTVTLRPERVETLGAVTVPDQDIARILSHLGCSVAKASDHFAVSLPSWRADIEGEADLVEEVLRLHGYDHIPAVPLRPVGALPGQAVDANQRRAGLVRRTLAERGLHEAVTYSFMSSALFGIGNAGLFGTADASLAVANPISSDLDVMRPSILPNLLTAAQRNADRGYGDAALFELGPQYRDDTPEGQALVAAGIRHGRTARKLWRNAGAPVDAFDAKADALAALAAAGAPVENLQVTADPPGWYHPGRGGSIRLGPKTVLAHFGEIHPRLVTALGLKGPAVGFEVYLDAVPPVKAQKGRPLLKLSPFQPIERDFAFLVDQTVPAEAVLRAARGADKKLVTEVRLFDVYTGQGVPEGKKSLALTVTLQPVEATLTDEAIEAVSKTIVAQVTKLTGAVLRG
ncbi:phenylalanine--tRNA ligase beta subunit [Aliidongia dinghuensis]|uniref:Phenylalanine--tRNA ligase beta subunit n=1 Tax=Aliidongia dinghuensis TaxID=1867774 RepID=A0A8J3E4M6_9PROT|nr:phenylalanine--tRNA ligase subunit beta [Aliidongia dinghuensis]GGF40036.1 phenylalanine--tRNA ligase beta subunit [Aliidongia dinghuensis]